MENQGTDDPMKGRAAMNESKLANRSPWIFFLLVYALTLPLWLLSTRVHFEGLPDNLPVTDIGATFVPLLAALILVYREKKGKGVRELLGKTFDYRKIKERAWYGPILFLMPLVYLLTYWVMRWLGFAVPAEWTIPLMAPVIFIFFFIGAAGEELGYTGYAIDPLQQRWGALGACLIMGPLWAFWHFPSMIELGQAPALMAWGFFFTVAVRILNVWIYNNTGKSVFAVILFHAVGNTARSLFPGGRPHFELGNAAVGYSIIILTAIVVIFLWGPKTLARFRYAA
jgi:membrane protease YdiL (CAAX protease family)